jgi:hypothetical protein
MSALDILAPVGATKADGGGAPRLRADELGLFDATVVAVSSVAPAYSLAATTLSASLPVLVALALGLPLVIVARRRSKSDYFTRRPVAYDFIE